MKRFEELKKATLGLILFLFALDNNAFGQCSPINVNVHPDADLVLGAADNNYLVLNTTNDVVRIDFGYLVPSGTVITLTVNRTNTTAGTSTFDVRDSDDGITYSAITTLSTTVLAPLTETKTYTLTANARYLRIIRNAGNTGVDAVYFNCGSTSCGSLAGIVNSYFPVTAISGNVLTVGKNFGVVHQIAVGDKILVIQMTGNTSANAGKFEYAIVTGVSGNNITVDGLTRIYTPTTEKVQLIYIPCSQENTITVTSDIKPLAWEGTVGGVVSLLTPNILNLNANINADGTGFRYDDYNKAIEGTNIFYGGGGGSNAGWRNSGGGGGGFGSGGKGGIFTDEATSEYFYGQDGTYIGGNSDAAVNYGGSGGGGGGGVGGAGGGGGGAEGGGGGGGASLSAGGCGGTGGGSASGGIGSVNGLGDTDGADGRYGGGGGGGGAYIGGGGGSGFEAYGGAKDDGYGGKSGSNGGAGGYKAVAIGGKGGGNLPSGGFPTIHNYFTCDVNGNCPDPRAWMGGGGQLSAYGGGIVLVSAQTILTTSKTISVRGLDGVLLKNRGAKPVDLAGNGGGGGGGGGLIVLNVKNVTGGSLNLCAKGGDGKQGELTTYVSGGSGGAGGAGAIWIYDPTNPGTNIGTPPPTIANVNFCTDMSIGGAAQVNPKTSAFSGSGGCGSGSLIINNPNCEIFELCSADCAISSVTATPSTCTPATNTYSVSGNITFSNAPSSGTLTVSMGAATQVFNAPFTSPQAYTLTGLAADGASHTVTTVFSADAACTNTVNYTAPVSCAVVPVCSVSLTANPSTCTPATNTYSVSGNITFSNAPSSGTLTVSMGAATQVFNAPFTSPQAYTLTGLAADGASHTVTAVFSADAACTNTVNYTAPVSCAVNCTVPNAGPDVTICLPKTTTNLTDASAGYEWVAVAGNPSAATINATTGVVSGMTAVGVYRFRLQKTGDAACFDEVNVTVTNGDVPIVLCNNGSTSYSLIAPSNLTNVIWYNMAGTQVGTGGTLSVTSNTTGLSDGSEAFYYIGVDGSASGCDVELCCPVKFLTQTCCPTPNCATITIIKN